MQPTQLKLKPEYRVKLKALALLEGRTMANMNEYLIDTAISLKTSPKLSKLLKKASK